MVIPMRSLDRRRTIGLRVEVPRVSTLRVDGATTAGILRGGVFVITILEVRLLLLLLLLKVVLLLWCLMKVLWKMLLLGRCTRGRRR